MRARFIDINGVETRVLEAGEPGRYPILMIHGGGVAADTWVKNIDVLAEHFHVVAPDMVGHGFTRPVDFGDDAPHPKTVEHLAGVVEHYGFERLCICGSSYGALISSLLALRLGGRVDRLVLNGSGSMFNTPEEHRRALEGTLANSMSAFDNPTNDNCRTRLGRILYDPDTIPDEVVHMQVTQYSLPWARQAWADTLKAMMNEGVSDQHRMLHRLELLTMKCLVIWGREDTRGLLASAENAIGRIPDARLKVIERCGHMPYMERPEEFNEIMKEFCRDGGV